MILYFFWRLLSQQVPVTRVRVRYLPWLQTFCLKFIFIIYLFWKVLLCLSSVFLAQISFWTMKLKTFKLTLTVFFLQKHVYLLVWQPLQFCCGWITCPTWMTPFLSSSSHFLQSIKVASQERFGHLHHSIQIFLVKTHNRDAAAQKKTSN